MGKKRNPVVTLLLMIVTFGIYFFVWFYKANTELKPLSRQTWSVGLWTFLILIPIAGIVSLWMMADNVFAARSARNVPGMGKVAMFLLLFLPLVNLIGIPLVQSEMNKVWGGMPATMGGARAAAA